MTVETAAVEVVEEKIGAKLRQLRKAARLDQAELAELSGVSASYISRLESGELENPTVDFLGRLTSVFGLSIDEFLGNKAPPESVDPELNTFIERLKKHRPSPTIMRLMVALVNTEEGEEKKAS